MAYGTASHSYLNNVRYSNTENIKEYIKNMKKLQSSIKDELEIRKSTKNEIEESIYEIHEIQDVEDMQKEYMLLGLRKIDGVSIQSFKNKFVVNPLYLFHNELQKLVTEGLIEIEGDRIKLTIRGIDLANLVWEEFVTIHDLS